MAVKPTAVIVDIDGTLALMGKRSPCSTRVVEEDAPNEPVIEVVCVLDDRNQTVRMWRQLGLTCLQVAYGDF